MNTAGWFQKQLQITTERLIWAIEHVPTERQFLAPPNPSYFGTWSAARVVFHFFF